MPEPFLRWAGGKRWLASQLAPLLARRLSIKGTYIEPFLGSGAIFFGLEPTRAVLGDLNHDLIGAYRAVAWRHGVIRSRLRKLPTCEETYYRLRSSRPTGKVDRAVRLIYLNRNCFGGLYRENRAGEFNVPFGGGTRSHLPLCKNGILAGAARALRDAQARLITGDFEATMRVAGEGDVVYCDPTYRDVTRRQFDRYGSTVFDWKDQERLAEAASSAMHRGALVLLSNLRSSVLRSLYPTAAVVRVVRRQGLGPARSRDTRGECLFVMDPAGCWAEWATLGPISLPGGRQSERLQPRDPRPVVRRLRGVDCASRLPHRTDSPPWGSQRRSLLRATTA